MDQNHKSISTQSTLEEEVGSGFPSYPLHRKDTSETLYSHETSTVQYPTHPTQIMFLKQLSLQTSVYVCKFYALAKLNLTFYDCANS